MKLNPKLGLAVTVFALAMSSAPAFANLIVNGGFEASTFPTATPTGWTNIGHSDGIIAYSQFGPTPYEGLNFYDLGGFGDPSGPTGDGISQAVATVAGTTYQLDFGLSSENVGNNSGAELLNVCFNGSGCVVFGLPIDGSGGFQKPFTTQTLSYLASNSLTAISFTALVGGGSNDALIDNVIFDASGTTSVPEPTTLALLGLGLVGFAARRRRSA